MTWISQLEEERRNLERLIDSAQEDASSSRRLSVSSLRRQLRDVNAQLADATRPQVVLNLSGKPVRDHEIFLATPEGPVITGKVRDDLVPSLRSWYEKPVIATLQVTVTRSLTTGVEKRRYLLVGLADADNRSAASDS